MYGPRPSLVLKSAAVDGVKTRRHSKKRQEKPTAKGMTITPSMKICPLACSCSGGRGRARPTREGPGSRPIGGTALASLLPA
jgi:hypothetical protein